MGNGGRAERYTKANDELHASAALLPGKRSSVPSGQVRHDTHLDDVANGNTPLILQWTEHLQSKPESSYYVVRYCSSGNSISSHDDVCVMFCKAVQVVQLRYWTNRGKSSVRKAPR